MQGVFVGNCMPWMRFVLQGDGFELCDDSFWGKYVARLISVGWPVRHYLIQVKTKK